MSENTNDESAPSAETLDRVKVSVLASDMDGTFIPLDDSSQNRRDLTTLTDELQRRQMELIYVTGRHYELFEYHGDPAAQRIVILMGSGADTVRETVDWLQAHDAAVGVIQVHLYRPFSVEHLLAALPASTRAIAELDRTKEPGAPGEPLYLDILTTLAQAAADGTLAALETTNAANVERYRGAGWSVSGEVDVDDLRVWVMTHPGIP